MLTKSIHIIFIISFLLAFVMIAQAQFTNPHTGYTWNNMISATLDTTIMNNMQSMQLTGVLTSNMLATQMLIEAGTTQSPPKIDTNPATSKLGTTVTSFTPSSDIDVQINSFPKTGKIMP